jgi:hypothetical protein
LLPKSQGKKAKTVEEFFTPARTLWRINNTQRLGKTDANDTRPGPTDCNKAELFFKSAFIALCTNSQGQKFGNCKALLIVLDGVYLRGCYEK